MTERNRAYHTVHAFKYILKSVIDQKTATFFSSVCVSWFDDVLQYLSNSLLFCFWSPEARLPMILVNDPLTFLIVPP